MVDENTNEVSRETLEATPVRVVALLRGVGTNKSIAAAMATRGFGPKDQTEGWTLLHAASGYVVGGGSETDSRVAHAIKSIDEADEPTMRVGRAVLGRGFREQQQFVFAGLQPAVGAASVVGMKLLLDRLDALENSSERKSTRKQDHAALEALGKAGIDDAERKRLRDLIEVAESTADHEGDADRAGRDEAYVQSLKELRGWYEKWSEIAKVAVTRRDHLIRLGLAKRKAKKSKADVPQPVAPA